MFPHAVREIENTWIPMSDGCRLAARIWLPEDAEDDPVPAILEYIPYRKNDGTAERDAVRHAYFAGHGYASVRVDMRGSGDSDGILYDEYLKQEQDDALEVLAWLAHQPWCTGDAGIIGKSWGGFNGLQIAARRPPELKAVISVYSTDDRYADDVHYMGGCLLAADMLPWASIMLAYNARPPDPKYVGERWREMWLDRLEKTPPFIEAWLTHQRRDDFWKHGSVCEDFGVPSTSLRRGSGQGSGRGIECPVYAIGGWADAYTNAVLRLLEGLPGPRKGLIGPWSHQYPDVADPGPEIGFLQECLRWWDYWLKGIDTGIMDEPMLRAWMEDSVEPAPYHEVWPGRWAAESAWPSPNSQLASLWLADGRLSETPPSETQIEYRGPQHHGLDAGAWCSYGNPADLPPDQRDEDGLSLTFTSDPLDEPLEILGFPEAELTVAADRPNALVAVRLCDVSTTGASTLITRGLLNLTHRDGHEDLDPLEPGERYTVTVRLNAIAYSVPAGHRLRVAVSPTYWPYAWPSPEPVTLTVFAGAESRLQLPVRPPRPEDDELPAFEPPEGAPPLDVEVLRTGQSNRFKHYDVANGSYTLTVVNDSGRRRIVRDGLEHAGTVTDIYTIVEGDPLSAEVRCERTVHVGRGDWHTRVETVSTMTSDAESFHVTNLVDAYEGNTRVFTKTWTFTVPRDHV
ncbi:MAG: Cocaine esterase [Anaerolineales bacterium]|nr:Cocaine esterase [Anaerolineales bacterium]